jgi:hypothetical protein
MVGIAFAAEASSWTDSGSVECTSETVDHFFEMAGTAAVSPVGTDLGSPECTRESVDHFFDNSGVIAEPTVMAGSSFDSANDLHPRCKLCKASCGGGADPTAEEINACMEKCVRDDCRHSTAG